MHDTVACPFPFFMLECALKLAMNFFTYYLISFAKDALKDAFFIKCRIYNVFLSIGINVTIRRKMGRDIDGACGHLRCRHLTRDKEREV